MKRNKEKRKLIIWIFLLIVALLLIIFSKRLFSWGDEINVMDANQAPNMQHWFGTDNLGRDLLCRSLIGLRLSLLLAAEVQLICLFAGIVIGSISAYVGGILDRLFVSIQSVILSFPGTVVTLCVMMMLGNGIGSMIVALCIFGWLSYARLTRSQVLTLKEADYIKGEIAIGSTFCQIQFCHIIPTVLRSLIPMFTLMIGHSVLGIAGLSFLGFGVQPPNAEIGIMIQDGLVYLRSAPWMFLFPGLVLTVYSVLFNSVGDALSDYFDPRGSENSARM